MTLTIFLLRDGSRGQILECGWILRLHLKMNVAPSLHNSPSLKLFLDFPFPLQAEGLILNSAAFLEDVEELPVGWGKFSISSSGHYGREYDDQHQIMQKA
jgi:hypothetical protein